MNFLPYAEYTSMVNKAASRGEELAAKLLTKPLPAELYEAAIEQFCSNSEDVEFIDNLTVNRGVNIITMVGSLEIEVFYLQLLGKPETPLMAMAAAAVLQVEGVLYLYISANKIAEYEKLERFSLYVHEFVHVDQYLAGRLVMDFGVVIWEGEPCITAECLSSLTLEDYLALPWEKEAYRVQGEFIEQGF